MQASPGTLTEQASWRDILNILRPSTFSEYVEDAPPGVPRKVLELGFWLGIEPGAYKQQVRR